MKKFTLFALSLLLLTACNQAVAPTSDTTTDTSTDTSTEATSDTSVEYTIDEVAKHADKSDCWSVVDGKVYDLTNWISKHPGGAGNILKICGIDGTKAFESQHEGNGKVADTLAEFYLADLQ